ncbi:hypothetical protein Patl_0691 [Paraglaciecola sp. T6c]|uniref:hypothetical protein n=1 Tax=Pseudoalteromonas atlantica (strain T6c / ATCC BAA-1087) TaxID=3042615 RepID=UPI00005C7088|nr:hypothetical protein [Paraglaciecola sp. T6c]ABG39219.1 hypothetical protein Patl_0691 [Paraglaciecola sp. T6c]
MSFKKVPQCMGIELNKINRIMDVFESSFEYKFSKIVEGYKENLSENKESKESNKSKMEALENQYEREVIAKGGEYVEPPSTSDDYIEAHYEILGAEGYERQLKYEITALLEMQIIYAHKKVEISLKQFIEILSGEDVSGENINWPGLISRFKKFDINLPEIQGYESVNNIRTVNNSLKHSHVISKSVKKIRAPEFLGEKMFNDDNLFCFYTANVENRDLFVRTVAYLVGISQGINTDSLAEISYGTIYQVEMDDIPF